MISWAGTHRLHPKTGCGMIIKHIGLTGRHADRQPRISKGEQDHAERFHHACRQWRIPGGHPVKRDRPCLRGPAGAFRQAPWPGAKERVAHLYRLREGLKTYQKTIIEAPLTRIFEGRSADETLLAELFPSMEGLAYAARHVTGWMKPSRRTPGLMFRPARARVEYQPKA